MRSDDVMTKRNRACAIGPRRALACAAATVWIGLSAGLAAGRPAGGAGGAHGARSPALEALDHAFRFASAIHADRKDQSMAQEAVIQQLAALGEIDTAIRWTGRVQGWRRGTLYADLAARLAAQGRPAEARELLLKAEEVRLRTEGWQGPRIAAHVAHALGALGEPDRSKQIAATLAAEDRQYAGRSVASVAAGLAAAGRFDEAMDMMARLDGLEDFDVSWWRTSGYLELARLAHGTAEQRRRAAEKALASARQIPGWKKGEALGEVAGLLMELGDSAAARATIRSARQDALGQPDTLPRKVALLASLAIASSRLGDEEEARRLLGLAEAITPTTVLIDRPGLHAEVGAAWWSLGDEGTAARLLEEALAAAEGLVNARPRALAAVSICQSMARVGAPLTGPIRGRLDALLGGLKEPW